MCIIVYKPVNQLVPLKTLKDCWDGNKDGAGLMFAEDGQLKIAKGFMDWKRFKKYYNRFGEERMLSVPMVFHFRIATHGSVGPANCHPFKVHNDLWFAHNGIISAVDVPKDRDISDTEAFAEQYLGYLHSNLEGGLTIGHLATERYYGGTPINDMIGKFIVGSKLVFMNGRGEVAIVNETAGTWDGEIWFSNRTYKRYTYVTPAKPASTPWRGPAQGSLGYTWQPAGTRSGALLAVDVDDDECRHVAGRSYISEQSEWYKEIGNKDYHCNTCSYDFKRRDAKVITWVGNKQTLTCPECKGKDTSEVVEAEVEKNPSEISAEDYWECYDCASWFWSDESSGTIETDNGVYLICPWCGGGRTYSEKDEHYVEQFGDDWFETLPPDDMAVVSGVEAFDEYLEREDAEIAADDAAQLPEGGWDEIERQTQAEWDQLLEELDRTAN